MKCVQTRIYDYGNGENSWLSSSQKSVLENR